MSNLQTAQHNPVIGYMAKLNALPKTTQVNDPAIKTFTQFLDEVLRSEGWRDMHGLPYKVHNNRASHLEQIKRIMMRFKLPGPEVVRQLVHNLRLPHVEASLYGGALFADRQGENGTQRGPSLAQMLRTLNSKELALIVTAANIEIPETLSDPNSMALLAPQARVKICLLNIARAFRKCDDDRAKMKYLVIMYPSFDPFLVASVQPLLSLWAMLHVSDAVWNEQHPKGDVHIKHNACTASKIHGVTLSEAWLNRGLGTPGNKMEKATIEEIQLLSNGRFVPHVEVI